MKSGISLVDMAKEIQRQADLKADYMLDTRSLRLEPFDSKLYLNAYDQSGVPALEPLEVNSIAHRQIGTHLKIPAAYYANGFKEQIKAINIQRALINEEQRTNDCDYVIPESATAPGSPDGSYVVGEINGSYEKLPA